MLEFKLESYDKTPIFVTIWEDVKEPKGVVQIAHGMAEYAGRYRHFAKFLNENGYIVFADDHRAHGRTEDDKTRGNHEGDIFQKTLKDMVFFYDWLKKKYNLPVFFLGHSYGSFIGQAFAQSGTDCKAIALLGTSQMGTVNMATATAFVAPLWLLAKNWKPKSVNFLSDKLLRYKNDKGNIQWITKDLERRQDFIDDPLCQIDMSVNFDYQMLKNLSKMYNKKALAKLNPNTKLGLFCGTKDPVGLYGINSTRLYKTYKKCGIDTKLFMYKDDRHEVLNETDRDVVQNDILNFFNNALEN